MKEAEQYVQSQAHSKQAHFIEEEQRWNAVLERDPVADGAFYYGVSSTGIFCRPTCPSRRPSKQRVTFFDTAGEALGHGYRPCKRCRPESQSPDVEFVQQVVDVIDGWGDGKPTLADLAEAVGMSPGHLQRKFKAATGISPAEYSRKRRIDKFRTELKGGRDVTGSVYEAGFESSASLYESVDRELGMAPTDYKSGAEKRQIHYLTAMSPLGRLMLAYTEVGVASIQIGDNDDELSGYSKENSRRPKSCGIRSNHPWLQIVIDYLSGEIPHPELPLDIQGTAFQRRVWQAIRVIPSGETRSYRDIAEELGTQVLCEPWRMPAGEIAWHSRYPAIASFGPMVLPVDIDGALSAKRLCCRWRPMRRKTDTGPSAVEWR